VTHARRGLDSQNADGRLVHESAHAIAALKVRLLVERITVRSAADGSIGAVELGERAKRGDPPERLARFAAMALAGGIAEAELAGCGGGSADDGAWVADLVALAPPRKREATFRAAKQTAERIVRENGKAIEGLAAVLARAHHLNADGIEGARAALFHRPARAERLPVHRCAHDPAAWWRQASTVYSVMRRHMATR